ncbi:corticoliberin isoform X2 [Hemitrygon akajei]|uniref:corticoliberin isoform X2 n=1 Tax=Hemitrygon akajei TaxID=2704970 RepID=UPI003BF9F97E
MKISVLLCTAVLLVGFVPGDDCRALQNSVSTKHGPGQQSELQRLIPRGWVHLDEEYIRPQAYNNPSTLDRNLVEMFPVDAASKTALAHVQRTLHGAVGGLNDADGRQEDLVDEMLERAKRRGTPSLSSLDVPLHVLSKMIAIARVEQLVRQAEENRKIMDAVGK